MPGQVGIHAAFDSIRRMLHQLSMGPSLRWGDAVRVRTLKLSSHASAGWNPCFLRGMIRRMKGGWVYIMTNAPYGTLYVGVTANLPARIQQHQSGRGSVFCKEHGLYRLVYCEPYERIDEAIAREKAMKAWHRRWKTKLIEKANPQWKDLSAHLLEASF